MSVPQDLIGFDFHALAEFHYLIRRFVKLIPNRSTGAIAFGSLQHQLLLNIRGLPRELRPTIGTLAERMQIRHHSAVELIKRSVELGLVERRPDKVDRRQVTVHLTSKGNRLASEIAQRDSNELNTGGHELFRVLRSMLHQPNERRRKALRIS